MSFDDRFTRRAFMQAGAGLSAAALSACACPRRTDFEWNNALKTAGSDPARICEPSTLHDVVGLVREAEAEGKRIRMVGAGHSFSDVNLTDGYMLLPTQLNRVPHLELDQLKPDARGRNLLRVEAGIRVRQLNFYLEQHGLGLENMGGYDAQTIVGAAMTGTHGSGLKFGPIASQIRSIQLVRAGGEVVQLEPSDGITDPARFPGYINTHVRREPATLIQDDDEFNAVAVSMGTMGVVYAVVLEAVPFFWLREERALTTWGELTAQDGFLREVMRGQMGTRPSDPTYYEIYVNPYPAEEGGPAASHQAILTRRWPYHGETANLSARVRTRSGQRLTGDVVRGDLLQALIPRFIDAGGGPTVIESSLKTLHDLEYINKSYKVFNLGPANHFEAYGIEMGFDLQQSIGAFEHLFHVAARLRRGGILHATPPSLRFVKASDAHLAMMQGRDTMMLEMGMFVCSDHGDELLTTYEREFIDHFDARPHWGLDLNVLQSFAEVEALFPRAREWLPIYRRYNGKGTFDGPLTDRLKISMRPPTG